MPQLIDGSPSLPKRVTDAGSNSSATLGGRISQGVCRGGWNVGTAAARACHERPCSLISGPEGARCNRNSRARRFGCFCHALRGHLAAARGRPHEGTEGHVQQMHRPPFCDHCQPLSLWFCPCNIDYARSCHAYELCDLPDLGSAAVVPGQCRLEGRGVRVLSPHQVPHGLDVPLRASREERKRRGRKRHETASQRTFEGCQRMYRR
ncbi:hypothetical protein TOPH_00682 [Tolypocladium ophioglossoides CBS 100239]|uniref:Uncharacterized protein n=1 Tax=Tolypocladium ophioglossoides (strain CBS 100239) TaxID=1163406 RepID=A0A0L0NL00_TOLOC|nr:hypothetical protein TOPH_00682 [Tolypocladium ophioglossoides CBS 100239]